MTRRDRRRDVCDTTSSVPGTAMGTPARVLRGGDAPLRNAATVGVRMGTTVTGRRGGAVAGRWQWQLHMLDQVL